MRTVVILSSWAALSLCIAAPTVRADERPVESRRTISVVGQGEVTAAPDLAIVAVAVETTAAKAADAVKENAGRSTKVASALKGLIGAEDKVTTTRYTLDPRYEAIKGGEAHEPRIIGYVAHNEVRVETRKVDAVGALIDAATDAGANRVSELQFSLSNRNEQSRAALQKAGAEARAQADSVAQAIGVKLKGVLSATTTMGPVLQPRHFEAFGMAAAAARPPTPIEPGTLSVSATLQVTYEIE